MKIGHEGRFFSIRGGRMKTDPLSAAPVGIPAGPGGRKMEPLLLSLLLWQERQGFVKGWMAQAAENGLLGKGLSSLCLEIDLTAFFLNNSRFRIERYGPWGTYADYRLSVIFSSSFGFLFCKLSGFREVNRSCFLAAVPVGTSSLIAKEERGVSRGPAAEMVRKRGKMCAGCIPTAFFYMVECGRVQHNHLLRPGDRQVF